MATQSGAITSLLLSQYPRGRAETPPQQRFALRSASQEWVEEPGTPEWAVSVSGERIRPGPRQPRIPSAAGVTPPGSRGSAGGAWAGSGMEGWTGAAPGTPLGGERPSAPAAEQDAAAARPSELNDERAAQRQPRDAPASEWIRVPCDREGRRDPAVRPSFPTTNWPPVLPTPPRAVT